MHACEIADTLEIPIVIVPQHPVLSALGMLLADVRKDYSRLFSNYPISSPFMILMPPLIDRAKTDVVSEGFTLPRTWSLAALSICVIKVRTPRSNVPFARAFNAEFHREHQRLYGCSGPARITEVVNVRVSAAGITRKYIFPSSPAQPQPLPTQPSPRGQPGSKRRLARHRDLPRRAPATGHTRAGPAILTGGQSTVQPIPTSFGFRMDDMGSSR